MPINDEILDDRVQLIVADCHDSDERAMAWFYYVAEEISYPFQAKCISEIPSSPLLKDEAVEVRDIASAEACEHTIFCSNILEESFFCCSIRTINGHQCL